MNPHVHQAAITEHDPPRLTGYSVEATRSVRETFPDGCYRLWGRVEGEQFIADHFPAEVLWAYRSLRPFAYKGDLLKLCLLHVLGGWYVDVGVRMLLSPAPLFEGGDPPDFVVFRSTGFWDAPWNSSLALVYAEAGSPVFTTAIDEVVANCRAQRYGANPLSPTMSPFGRALAHHRIESGLVVGTVVDVEGQAFNRGFEVEPLGLVAARKPTGILVGDVASIGLEGGNDYGELWLARRVYTGARPPTRWRRFRGPGA